MSKINEIQRWEIEDGLLSSPAVTNRDLFAQKFDKKNADDIFKKYAYLDRNEMKDFYSRVFSLIDDVNIHGDGLELGAGVCGFSTAICSYFPSVRNIYAVELVPDVVKLLQPITIPSVCGDDSNKIKRVIGSFNNIELEDNSLDFCFEVDSLHHSEQLDKTLKEIHRVLKPGGHLIMLDRAHNNKVTDEQIKYMLDVEYSEDWKRGYGYDSAVLTRRENGEHEIRMNEWEKAFKKANMEMSKKIELRTVSLTKLIRGAILSIPFNIRRMVKILPSRAMWHDGEWVWMLKKLLGFDKKNSIFKESIRDYTVFVIRKK